MQALITITIHVPCNVVIWCSLYIWLHGSFSWESCLLACKMVGACIRVPLRALTSLVIELNMGKASYYWYVHWSYLSTGRQTILYKLTSSLVILNSISHTNQKSTISQTHQEGQIKNKPQTALVLLIAEKWADQ